MRLRNSFQLIAPCRNLVFLLHFALAASCCGGTFAVVGPQSGSWPAVLSAVGHVPGRAADADVFVALPNTPAGADWQGKVGSGAPLILAGASPLARRLRFTLGGVRRTSPARRS